MSQQLQQLAVLHDLPKDLEQLECVVNRAFDVRSASMIYLSTYIRHDSTPLGIPGRNSSHIHLIMIGKILKILFTGENKFTNAKAYLRECVQLYSQAINNIVEPRLLITMSKQLEGTFGHYPYVR
jgi:hypothetical protein